MFHWFISAICWWIQILLQFWCLLTGHLIGWPLLGQISCYSLTRGKLLLIYLLIWRSDTRRWNLCVPDLQMSYKYITIWQWPLQWLLGDMPCRWIHCYVPRIMHMVHALLGPVLMKCRLFQPISLRVTSPAIGQLCAVIWLPQCSWSNPEVSLTLGKCITSIH